MQQQSQGRAGVPEAVGDATDEADALSARRAKYRGRFYRVWGYIGIGIIVVAAAMALGHVEDALFVVGLGALLAFLYAPIVNYLHRRFRVPRMLGTLIGLLVVFAAILLFFLAIVPPIAEQASGLIKAFPTYVSQLQELWLEFNDFIQSNPDGQVKAFLENLTTQAAGFGSQLAQQAAGGLFSGVTGFVGNFINVFMAFVISFWLAKDFPRMEREVSNIVGPKRGEDYRIITSVFSRSLSGYLKGVIITSTCTGLIAGVGFWILGIPYSLLLGFVTGVLNIIPYIGPWTGGALGFLVGLSVGPVPAVLSIVVSVIAQQLTDNLVSPKVMQSAVSVHPVLVIFALSAGGALGGIAGMIMAVPLTAALKGTFVYYFEKKTGRQLVSRDGMLFRGEEFRDEDGNPRPACDALGVDVKGDKGVPPRIREAELAARAAEEARAAAAAEQEQKALDNEKIGE